MIAQNQPTDARADELKRALLAIRDLRRQVQQLESRASEPIAIVGMACRLPGGANTPERFWDLLRNGVDATIEVPSDRWDIEQYYDPDPNAPGCMYTRRGGFLVDPIDQFDAAHFGISPREAAAMDPTHRILLELSWEALERAGIPPHSVHGSNTAVFIGLSGSDYNMVQALTPGSMNMYSGTGSALSVAGGRISHFFGFHGPNLTLDTACSSSLLSVVLAVEALRTNKCNMALAGGAQVMLAPEGTIYMCKLHALSPGGRCRTFDAAADGYGRGEGGGMVVLKRLSDAVRDGDPIVAVIRGAAYNHDGHSSGLTVPNPAAQRMVIEAALKDGGISPNDIDYVEAHGTATPLGDPIEVRALADVLGRTRAADAPLLIGSAKPNVGHLEAAAGVTGLIKLALAVSNAEIPPHINCEQPTPHIDWDAVPVRIVRESTTWKPDGVRTGGVSAFGLSGTNAHIILESAPKDERSPKHVSRPAELIVLSGKSRAAVRQLAERYREHVLQADPVGLPDIALTSLAGRSPLPFRATVVASTATEMAEALTSLAKAPDEVITNVKAPPAGRIAFLFTGQGAQYPGMARELYAHSPLVRSILDRCDEILRPHMDRSLIELLTAEEDAETIKQTQYAQPALFAIEYALAMLWQSWGIRPAALAGHSLGEYVAATVAGVLTLEDALPLIALRGRLMQALPAGGRMCAVFAPEAHVAAHVATVPGVSIAAINGPANTVISGPASAVDDVLGRLQQEGSDSRDLHVSHAFHSALMDPMLDAFEDAIRRVKLNAPQIPLVSNVTGELLTTHDAVDPGRWRRHIRECVRFAPSLHTLFGLGVTTFLEIGPHPALSAMGTSTLTEAGVRWLPSMRRGRSAWQQLLETAGELWRTGYELDTTGFAREHGGRRVAAPTYPFQRSRFWFSDDLPKAPALSRRRASAATRESPHPLLDRALRSPAFDGWVFETVFEPQEGSYFEHHRVGEHAIVPAAAFVEMMLESARHGPGWNNARLDGLLLAHPLVLDPVRPTYCQVIIGQPIGGVAQVRLVASTEERDGLVTIASGELRNALDRTAPAPEPVEILRTRYPESARVDSLYASIEQRGITYGPAFRTLVEAWVGAEGALGRARLNEQTDATGYQLHPCLFDAGFHLLASITGTGDDASATFLPVGIDSVRVYRPAGAACWIRGAVRNSEPASPDHLTCDLQLLDDDGNIIATIDGFHTHRVHTAIRGHVEDRSIHGLDWEEITTAVPETARVGTWLLIDGDAAESDLLEQALVRRGVECVRVRPADVASMKVVSQPAAGVIHLQSLAAPSGSNPEAVADAIVGCADVFMHLLRNRIAGDGTVLRVVTRGATGAEGPAGSNWAVGAALWGAVPGIRSEHPELQPRIVDIDPNASADYDLLAAWLLGDTDEDRIVLRDGRAFAPRLIRGLPSAAHPRTPDMIPADNYRLVPERRGTLDSIQYVPATRVPPGPGEVEVRVLVTGLNFRDVLNVLGMYPGDPGNPGVEFAGIVTSIGEGVTHVAPGDPVIGMGLGMFTAYTTRTALAVVPMPRNLTPEEAVTIPLAFMSAEWGLVHAAGLRRGERVLIHAAAGGVGQAAVQIAQAIGAEVFATAGSEAKREYLRAQGVRHVFDSRSTSFADDVLTATGGAGVDVVLNSLTGELLRRSLDLLGPGGRFIELGLADLLDPAHVAQTHPGVHYQTFQLGNLPISEEQFHDIFRTLARRFESGELRPLRVASFPAERVTDAFHHMAQARHIGKIVVTSARVSTHGIHGDGAYLVTGASGGIGRGLVEWLVERGAGALILNARSAPGADTEQWLQSLRQQGASISWISGDTAVRADVDAMIASADRTGLPLRGVFHVAGVLDDGLLSGYDTDRFARVLAPKVQGAYHLHAATARLNLDHFVLFSSVAGFMAGTGQVAYAAGNAFLSALAKHRRNRGLAGLCIDWGAWANSGMAARLSDRESRMLEDRGMLLLEHANAFDTLGRLLELGPDRAVVVNIDWQRLRSATGSRSLPLLGRMLTATPAPVTGAAAQASTQMLDAAALAELTPEERDARINTYIIDAITSVLRLRPGQLETDSQLVSLGLDSLISMELRNRIETDLGVLLPTAVLLQAETPAVIAAAIVSRAPVAVAAGNVSSDWTEGEI